MTADRTQAAEVLIYSCGTTLTRCITQQPQAESYVIEGSSYPAPSFSVGLADVTVDSIRWFADGAEQPCGTPVFTADILKDQPAGVHRVSCAVAAHDSDGYHYREQSAEATFVITKGVVPDSIMTFSDIHEEYGLIRDAIRTVMQKTGGYIPALVICSGDFVNGPTMQTDLELSRYFPQIVSALGGLDAVYVAGNHDSAEAAALMSSAAGLGAAKNLPAAGGVIFDGESEAVAQNGKNSRSAKGIINYGINYDAALRRMDDGSLYRTYEDVIRSVDSFLKETAAQYHGELVVISAHSGLHVVGLQPDSENGYYSPQYGWAGENAYNIDMSCELAQTLNRYAEQYDMNILYLYGHDHSRNEQEIFLTDGDTLISPKRYDNRSYENVTLHFTYANAGYLSSVIGSASKKFSFIQRDGSSLTYDLLRSADGSVRHAEWKEKHPYEAPAGTTETPAVTTSAARTSATGTTAAAQKSAAPDTGDYNMLLLAVPACLALLLTGKKHAP